MEKNPASLLTEDFLQALFPPERADQFFDALYGGAEEGAFDISLEVEGFDASRNELMLVFKLTERPGKCMACSLTFGLPPVFQRHPVINLKGLVEKIEETLAPDWKCVDYSLGSTQPRAPKVNVIPFNIKLSQNHAGG